MIQIRPEVEGPPAEVSKSKTRGSSGSRPSTADLMERHASVTHKQACKWETREELKKKYGKLRRMWRKLIIRNSERCCETGRDVISVIPTALLGPLLKRFHANDGHIGREKILHALKGYHYRFSLLVAAAKLVSEWDLLASG